MRQEWGAVATFFVLYNLRHSISLLPYKKLDRSHDAKG